MGLTIASMGRASICESSHLRRAELGIGTIADYPAQRTNVGRRKRRAPCPRFLSTTGLFRPSPFYRTIALQASGASRILQGIPASAADKSKLPFRYRTGKHANLCLAASLLLVMAIGARAGHVNLCHCFKWSSMRIRNYRPAIHPRPCGRSTFGARIVQRNCVLYVTTATELTGPGPSALLAIGK